MNYRADIDGLRAVAVMAVLLFHAGFASFSGGFVGVDVFFVISGYLITRLIVDACARGRFSFGQFYLRRVRRLAPALLATLVGCLIAGYFVLPPSAMRALGQSTLFATFSASNILFWVQSDYFDTASALKPLLHTWSLSVEEQFYLLWPLTLVLLLRSGSRRVAAVTTAFCVVASLVACQWMLARDTSAAFFLLPFRVFELGLGALLVFAGGRSLPRNSWLEVLLGGGICMILVAVFDFTESTAFPGLAALLPCAGAVLVLYAGQARYLGMLLRNPVARGIGLVSYSLYLVHWPIIVFFHYATGDAPVGVERWGIVAASLILATVFYFFVETPFRHVRDAGLIASRRPRLQAALGNPGFGVAVIACALVVVIPAAHAWRSAGWAWRYDPGAEVRSLLAGRDVVKRPQHPIAHPRGRIAVVGDSHAAHLYLGLMEWGEAHQVVVDRHYLGGGCPPLLGISVFGDGAQRVACEAKRDRVLQAIAAADYDAVILVGRWGLYTGTLTAKDHVRARSLGADPGGEDHGDLEQSRAAFIQGIAASIDIMIDGGKQVLLVGQVPPLGEDPYPCIERHETITDVEERCGFASYRQAIGETAWSFDAMHALQQSRPELRLFDPTPALCPRQQCSLLHNGKMFYNDGNHLNNLGARFVADEMTPVLESLLVQTVIDADAPDRRGTQ